MCANNNLPVLSLLYIEQLCDITELLENKYNTLKKYSLTSYWEP